MIIEFILQVIFVILSYMCFKPDDILDLNYPILNMSKSINLYRLIILLSSNYFLVNEGIIYIYKTIVEYITYIFDSMSDLELSLMITSL